MGKRVCLPVDNPEGSGNVPGYLQAASIKWVGERQGDRQSRGVFVDAQGRPFELDAVEVPAACEVPCVAVVQQDPTSIGYINERARTDLADRGAL